MRLVESRLGESHEGLTIQMPPEYLNARDFHTSEEYIRRSDLSVIGYKSSVVNQRASSAKRGAACSDAMPPSTSNVFCRVNRRKPCRICGKPDRCVCYVEFQALIYSQSFFPFPLNLRIIVFLPQRGMAHIVFLPAP
jgi:hypothetical protein